jgi:hypothetical protein
MFDKTIPMRALHVLMLLLINCQLAAQNLDEYYLSIQKRHAEAFDYNPEYRVNYIENIAIKTLYYSDIAVYQFRSLDTGTNIELNPVAESLIGFSMDYKWFGLTLSFAPDFLLSSEDQNLVKNSRSLKIDLTGFYSDQWGQSLTILFNKGFNVDFSTDLSPEEIKALQNTEFQYYGGSTFFIVNQNFSYRANFNQTERQLKSAGSFLPRLTYAYSVTKPDLTAVNTDLLAKKIRSFDLIADLGYYYNFVLHKKWYLTLGAQPGVGFNYTNYEVVDSPSEAFASINFAFNGEAGLGYNSYRWFFGLTGNWRNYNNTNNENDQINRDSAYFLLHLGYRFNDNKPMRKAFGWVEQTLGLDY